MISSSRGRAGGERAAPNALPVQLMQLSGVSPRGSCPHWQAQKRKAAGLGIWHLPLMGLMHAYEGMFRETPYSTPYSARVSRKPSTQASAQLQHSLHADHPCAVTVRQDPHTSQSPAQQSLIESLRLLGDPARSAPNHLFTPEAEATLSLCDLRVASSSSINSNAATYMSISCCSSELLHVA